MGARDDFHIQRGLSKEAAASYLGVKRRTFERIAGDLRPAKLGTSLVYDVRDLDALFDRLKAANLVANEASAAELTLVSATSSSAAPSPTYRRPTKEKEANEWGAKAAFTKTQKAGGGSTGSIAESAFRAVSTRIRTQKLG